MSELAPQKLINDLHYKASKLLDFKGEILEDSRYAFLKTPNNGLSVRLTNFETISSLEYDESKYSKSKDTLLRLGRAFLSFDNYLTDTYSAERTDIFIPKLVQSGSVLNTRIEKFDIDRQFNQLIVVNSLFGVNPNDLTAKLHKIVDGNY